MTLTAILAAWGAALSTIIAVWNVRKDLHDRAQLRIEVHPSMEIYADNKQNIRASGKVKIQVFNDGRRACTLYEVGYVYHERPLAKLRRMLFGRIKFDLLRKSVKFSPINFQELPVKLDAEAIHELEPTWRSFFYVAYGQRIYFYARDTRGRVAFTKKYYSNYFKDPHKENFDEMGIEYDDELAKELKLPADPRNWYSWGIPKPWWHKLFELVNFRSY